MPNILRTLFYLCIRALKTPLLIIRKSNVSPSSKISFTTTLINTKVGQYNYIGGGTYLVRTVVGNYCSIASGVKIGGMEHSWWWASTSPHLSDYNISNNKTIIEDDVWIGVNAIIRQGVKIGRGAVIGAGSVVLKDIPPYAIVAGVPARLIRPRFDKDVISHIITTEYWNYPPKKAKEKLRKIDVPTSLQDSVKKH